MVPLSDRAIGNLKPWLLGTHHGVGRDQLQAYLDEFAFRPNRRKKPMAAFQTLLGLGTRHKSTLAFHCPLSWLIPGRTRLAGGLGIERQKPTLATGG